MRRLLILFLLRLHLRKPLSLLPEELRLARSLQSSGVQKMPQTREPVFENLPSSDRE
jgi:hypothetical protein